MGYTTYFTLEVSKDDVRIPLPKDLADRLTEFFDEIDDEEARTSSKWYDCEEDMKEFSTLFPELLFYIHGEGESSGDLWDLWVRNGKAQMCAAEITYPSYDPEKMK